MAIVANYVVVKKRMVNIAVHLRHCYVRGLPNGTPRADYILSSSQPLNAT